MLKRLTGGKPASESADWQEGYAAGKDKAHFEVRNVLEASHADHCGCEPCITVRIVALQLARRWGADI